MPSTQETLGTRVSYVNPGQSAFSRSHSDRRQTNRSGTRDRRTCRRTFPPFDLIGGFRVLASDARADVFDSPFSDREVRNSPTVSGARQCRKDREVTSCGSAGAHRRTMRFKGTEGTELAKCVNLFYASRLCISALTGITFQLNRKSRKLGHVRYNILQLFVF